MADQHLAIGLVLPGPKVADVVCLPRPALRRMARHAQARALAAGLSGPVTASLHLLPERASLRLATAMRFTLRAHGFTFVSELPTGLLAPLVSASAARLLAKEDLAADTPVSFIVLRPQADPEGPAWEEVLPSFATDGSSALPEGRPLLPEVACPGDLPVVLSEDALSAAACWCRDRSQERGGALLGHVHRAPGGGLWSEGLAFAAAEGAEAGAAHLTFNAAAWGSIARISASAQRSLGLARPLQVVGWAHGHPRANSDPASALFLSREDMTIMAQHFAEPFALALVFDAATDPAAAPADGLAAFGWDAAGVALVSRGLDMGPTSGAARMP